MKDRKYLQFYRMNYVAFQALVLELTYFCNHVWPQLEIRKIVAIVFHKFAYGHSAFYMANYFNMGI